MRRFIKLNIISAMYAFVLFIEFQTAINVYRITRITGLSFYTVRNLIDVFDIVVFIVSTITFFFVTKKYLTNEKLKFLPTILWMPYYIVFTIIGNILIPITVRGDEPAPVIGILIMGAFLVYPFYIAFITLISTAKQN